MELQFIYELFTFLSFLASLPLLGFIGSGAGTSGDPFIVTSVAELDDMANDLGATGDLTYYELGNDIDYASGTFTTLGTCFIDLNGAGFTISNITFSSRGFINTLSEGLVEDLKLENVTVNTGVNRCGPMVGVLEAGATVRRCGVDGGTVTGASGSSFTGGFIGELDGTVENCYSRGVTVNAEDRDIVGGFYGTRGGTIDKCWSANTLTTNAGTGTSIGAFGPVSSGSITNCFFDSDVQADVGSDPSATGKTTAEMQDVATYTNVGATAGLDEAYDMVAIGSHDGQEATAIWAIDDGVEYPVLYFEVEVSSTTTGMNSLVGMKKRM